MKKLIYSLFAFAMVACSGPKYTASFNNVNSTLPYYAAQTETPTPVNPQELLASNAETPVIFDSAIEPAAEPVRKTYMQMTKAERKDLRQYLRAEIKSAANTKKMNSKMGVEAAHATKAMDHDLKLAAIFGAAGLVAMAIFAGNSVLWVVGGIALIIGVVFFVKWLVRQ